MCVININRLHNVHTALVRSLTGRATRNGLAKLNQLTLLLGSSIPGSSSTPIPSGCNNRPPQQAYYQSYLATFPKTIEDALLSCVDATLLRLFYFTTHHIQMMMMAMNIWAAIPSAAEPKPPNEPLLEIMQLESLGLSTSDSSAQCLGRRISLLLLPLSGDSHVHFALVPGRGIIIFTVIASTPVQQCNIM